MAVPQSVNAIAKAAADADAVKDQSKSNEVSKADGFHDLEGGRFTYSEQPCKRSRRTAQSAPCSPKGVLFRREQVNAGSTFRVRQSVKDGRSLLQICHSPPEFRSAPNNRYSKIRLGLPAALHL
ncbi:unnamed protein product [Enterobius vermicularis]|uniref:Uncharacterized protein n=1 Tax=Enterobius vermicularis TaxID=51028 RepID=A0A158QA71_ENTVE|nr:unnamed protein product [Enterobius vermicularis]